MRDNRLLWAKLSLFALLIGFALVSHLFPNLTERKVDNSILFLVTLAVLIVLLPWERLTSLRAGGVELSLDRPQIDKAIGDLKTLKGEENVSNERLRALLRRLAPEVEQSKGSRILWIDDTPDNVWGERRLFRALEIETVMATSSEMAKSILETDGDFDLIISDMRSGERFKRGEDTKPEAVRFVEQLRESELKRRQKARYRHIPAFPVVFYSGKAYAELVYLTESVSGPESAVRLARGVEMLITKVLETLLHVRSEPVEIVVGSTPGGSN